MIFKKLRYFNRFGLIFLSFFVGNNLLFHYICADIVKHKLEK